MLRSGEVVDDRYQVAGLVGRGGMAEVFRATDTTTDRAVALKVLRGHEPGHEDRFRTEADALARLAHPGLVRLRDAGTHRGAPYLVLDLADGPSLADVLADGRLGTGATVDVGRQVADALAHAHRAGVVHRDVKPSNILGDGTGRWRLADFGIARLAGAPSLTATGLVVGSPPYVAPEQVEGRAAGPPADVYALGLVLIECLTGCRCYPGGQIESALARLHRRPPIPAGAPGWLRDVLTAMTARDPLRRPPATAVAQALRDSAAEPVLGSTVEMPAVGRRPPPVRRRGPAPARSAGRRRAGGLAAAAALVVAAAIGLQVAGTGGDDPADGPAVPPVRATAPAARVGPMLASRVEPAATAATTAGTEAPPDDPGPPADAGPPDDVGPDENGDDGPTRRDDGGPGNGNGRGGENGRGRSGS
ncbi:MAG TPA: serine/threonine-protein kinase [Acidimicrobiales bacterium]